MSFSSGNGNGMELTFSWESEHAVFDPRADGGGGEYIADAG